MDFLYRILGIKVTERYAHTDFLPNYILARYDIREVSLDQVDAAFVYPKTDLDSTDAVKRHLERIKDALGAFPVLILNRLTYYQRERLLHERIPFIVEEKQVYLPFMALYMQKRCDSEKPEVLSFLPSAQVLLLYYIYQGCGRLYTSNAFRALGFTPTSISRASQQLEDTGLVNSERIGVEKIIFSDKTPREMFEDAKRFFINPVKRKIYVPKREINTRLLLSGDSALSEYSMMNPPTVECYASESISGWSDVMSKRLISSDEQYAVELWRYDPKKLSDSETVDRLSLALSLRDDKDERTEEAVEYMLEQVWRDIDGKRN